MCRDFVLRRAFDAAKLGFDDDGAVGIAAGKVRATLGVGYGPGVAFWGYDPTRGVAESGPAGWVSCWMSAQGSFGVAVCEHDAGLKPTPWACSGRVRYGAGAG